MLPRKQMFPACDGRTAPPPGVSLKHRLQFRMSRLGLGFCPRNQLAGAEGATGP